MGTSDFTTILTQVKFAMDTFGWTPYIMAFLVFGVVAALYTRFFNR